MKKDELLQWLSKTLLMQVSENTVLLKDVGLSGLDLDGFFTEFSDRYDVDMSSFVLTDYDPSSQSLLAVWFKGKRTKQFKVDHLLKVIERRTWFDPE